MRVLVADKNGVLLAAIAGTFGRHCDLVTAARRDVCMEQVERQKFDVVVACDKLADYTGLELLSEVAAASPGTLLIFVATPARLQSLGKRLALFGLFEALSYPLTPRKLLDVLKLARRNLASDAQKIRHVVLESESEWDTGERLGLVVRELEAQAAADPVNAVTWPAHEHETADDPVGTGELVFDAPAAPATRPGKAGGTSTFTRPIADADDVIEVAPSEVPVAHAPVNNDPAIEPSSEAPTALAAPVAKAPAAREPEWAGPANDPLFAIEPATPARKRSAPVHPSQTTHAPKQAQSGHAPHAEKLAKPSPAGNSTAGEAASRGAQPRVRTQAVTTDAHRAAFERALARRNAERETASQVPATTGRKRKSRGGFARAMLTAGQETFGPADPGSPSATSVSNVGSVFAEPTRSPLSTQSLSQLARMATTKRPLADSMAAAARRRLTNPAMNRAGPKRAVFVVGSGLAAVLLIGALTFELLRTPREARNTPHAATANTQVFSPGSLSTPNGVQTTVTPPFSPTSQEPPAAATAVSQPQAQTFDPQTAPPDPPPPPALEHPGPMEPPSAMMQQHGLVNGPPMGMLPPNFVPDPE